MPHCSIQSGTSLAQRVPGDVITGIEQTAKELFSRFEMVPKHEFEAQVAVLESLQAQVAELEQRLQQLETSA